jgi:hypothetical protein
MDEMPSVGSSWLILNWAIRSSRLIWPVIVESGALIEAMDVLPTARSCASSWTAAGDT